MEMLYLVLVIFLGILAISDLVVGVSNDAVNFMNSAIGSRVAPFRIIMLVAGLGIVIGATFSSGMMEIARSGVFFPEKFFFSEIMVIFLAVMMTDVILLDVFNTFGLPTSTTVSIVFELLGAAVAVTLYKLIQSGTGLVELGAYINSGKALAIISGILISVVIAFAVGSLIQYVVRLFFTFNYHKTYRFFGALFGGLSITSILYFMVMKGAKGASFMRPEYISWIEYHTADILLYVFLGFTLLFQSLILFFRVNIFPFLILAGTFALAFAFAGNDLVNFIGVPLAGLESFKIWAASGLQPGSVSMDALNQPVMTPTALLLLAGLIMVVTLWTSKKAKKVVATSINLSSKNNQSSENEQFESTALARAVVRTGIYISESIDHLIPDSLQKIISKRFRRKITRDEEEMTLPFDQIRAAVNLVVSSILIASATSLKLPLSTTYVTFMVAMGSSLADGAWDRETAVFRISGVVTVIGGWFFTALSAFTVSLAIALLIAWGGIPAIVVLAAFVVFLLIRSHILLKRKDHAAEEIRHKTDYLNVREVSGKKVYTYCSDTVLSLLIQVSKLYYTTLNGLIYQERKSLKSVKGEVEILLQQTKTEKTNVYKTVAKLNEDSLESAQLFIQIIDYMREASLCLRYMTTPVYEYVNNHHSPLIENQTSELALLNEEIAAFFNLAIHVCKNYRYETLENLQFQKTQILEHIDKIQKKQLRLIKKQQISTKNSVLVLNMLAESKNLVLFSVNMLKSCRDFYYHVHQPKGTAAIQ